MVMKFLVEDDTIIIVKAYPKIARECYEQSLKVILYFVKASPTNDTIPKPIRC